MLVIVVGRVVPFEVGVWGTLVLVAVGVRVAPVGA